VLAGASLFGLFLIGLSAYRAGKTQDELARKVDTITDLQSKLSSQVTVIQHNTEQPAKVTVNVPPQQGAPQSAVVTVVKLESAYDAQTNTGQIINTMLVEGMTVRQNLYFQNTGTAFADNIDGFGRV
jgi:hypothetical protein